MFPWWVEGALKTFKSLCLSCRTDAQRLASKQKNQTAQAFLKLMDKLQTVLIQDVAALLARDDCRSDHCLFHLELFQSAEFRSCAAKMRAHLQASKAPHDASIQEVLPGVQERIDAVNSSVHVVSDKCDLLIEEMPQQLQKVTELALNDFLTKTVSCVTNTAKQGSKDDPRREMPCPEAPCCTLTLP